MSPVSYQTSASLTIQDTRQIRLGGIEAPGGGGEVPEPASLFTAGLALGAFALIRKRS